MSDPVTLGGFVALVLAMGAEAALKAGVGEAVKDAYRSLKGLLSRLAPSEVEALEAAPRSNGKQLAVAEILDQQTEEDSAKIKALALALSEALQKAVETHPIGIDIGRLKAAYVHLQEINVTSGTGVRVQEVETPGGFVAGPVNVGKKTQ